jgi:hypothetical protein
MKRKKSFDEDAPSTPSCECIDPWDGHFWRTKYCTLEGGLLYFIVMKEMQI